VQTTGLLADGKFVGLMHSGFPLRLHYRLELWRSRSGWFDQYVGEAPWDAVARHDPLADDFVLIRTGGSVARYGTPEDLERALERRIASSGLPWAASRIASVASPMQMSHREPWSDSKHVSSERCPKCLAHSQ